MAALAYRDDKILARNLLSRPFFCLTPAEPFFRPDRSSTAPSCRVAVKDGRAFRGHPKGLSLTAASTMARWRYRSGRRPCVAAEQVSSPRRSSRFRFPFPQCLQKCGNSNREVHRLSRFSDHQTACSCSRHYPPQRSQDEPMADHSLERPRVHAPLPATCAAERSAQSPLLRPLAPNSARARSTSPHHAPARPSRNIVTSYRTR
jgi:hypothetical protein